MLEDLRFLAFRLQVLAPDRLRLDLSQRDHYLLRPRLQTARGIVPRIARNGIESRKRVGCDRWMAERIHDWLNHFRGLPIRYKRRAEIDKAFISLALPPHHH